MTRLTVAAVLALTTLAIAGAEELSWPPDRKTEAARKIVDERFEKASRTRLGRESDVEAITHAIVMNAHDREARINEIRWVSRSVVMANVCTYSCSQRHLYVVKHAGDNWRVLIRYEMGAT